MNRVRMNAMSSVLACLACAAAVSLIAARPADPPAKSDKATSKAEVMGDPYLLDVCIVSGEKLGSMGKPVVKEIDGREVRFCCNSCVKEFEKDKAKFTKKLDDAIIEQQLKHYPLKNCVVNTNDEVDAEGSGVNLVYKNRLVRFCCKDCVKEFNAEPAKYLARLDEAVVKQQKDQYPLDTCPISGEKLGADAVDHVVGVTLVRFCCKGCVSKFNADPLPAMAKLREGWAAKHKASGETH